MSWPVTNLSRIHVTGTSLTQTNTVTGDWAGRPGSLIDQIKAKNVAFSGAPAVSIVPARSGQSTPQSYSALPPRGRRQVVTRYGVGGRALAGLQADIQASVTCWAPDICIIEMGANDFGVTGVGGLGSAWAISMAATLDGIHAALPNCKIIVQSVLVHGENVTAGHLTDNADSWAGNSDTQLVIAANNRSSFAVYADCITPARDYCLANNTGGSTPRYLTLDNLHQTNIGSIIAANATIAQLTFS